MLSTPTPMKHLYLVLRQDLAESNSILSPCKRFHYEIENDFILKEYIHREAPCSELQNSVAFWTNPDEMQNFLPVKSKQMHKLFFK